MSVCGRVLLFLRMIALCMYVSVLSSNREKFFCVHVCLDQKFLQNHYFLMQTSSCTSKMLSLSAAVLQT